MKKIIFILTIIFLTSCQVEEVNPDQRPRPENGMSPRPQQLEEPRSY